MATFEEKSLFERTLLKYKITYFLSYDFFIHFSKIFLDTEYVVPLLVKPVNAMQYWHVVLTVPCDTDINYELKQAFQYLYKTFPYRKSLPKRSRSKSPKVKRVHFKDDTIHSSLVHSTSKLPYYIQQCISQARTIQLDKTLASLRDPRTKYPLTFKIYQMGDESD